MEIRYSSPDEALVKTLNRLRHEGIEESSRNGPVRRFAEPAILINTNPSNRVARSSIRDANPFFHFMEALWMIAGMNEVAPMAFFNSGIAQYSDDGSTLRGTAYGYKWRSHFGYDQLELAIRRLRENPTDRRVVMTMWDPRAEWKDPSSKDLSCNLQVIFGTREQDGVRVLDMEVTNRSNDIVYGCLGSNLFHFSFLLEYVAYKTGLQIGNYYQVAFNLHGYVENEAFARCYEATQTEESTNLLDPQRPYSGASLLRELGLKASASDIADFVRSGKAWQDPYLKAVGVPLYEAYRIFKLTAQGLKISKDRRIELAVDIARQCADPDLADAAVEWLYRRHSDPKIQELGRPKNDWRNLPIPEAPPERDYLENLPMKKTDGPYTYEGTETPLPVTSSPEPQAPKSKRRTQDTEVTRPRSEIEF